MNGYLLIDKESDFTSFDVIAKLRGILKTKKLGHTGTLDPNATGLLVVLAGAGTKAVPLLEHHTKTYEATLQLGVRTDTEDIWGEILEEQNLPEDISEEKIRQVLSSFLGKSMQVPPMYSAKKVNGQKLYDLARSGKVIERKPVPIEITEIEIRSIHLPYIEFTVTCSAGTYIRTLCTAIGEKLGTIAAMSSLRRTKVGEFSIENAYTLSQVQELLQNAVSPLDQLFQEYPACHLEERADRFLKNGNALTFDEVTISEGKETYLNGVEVYRMYFSSGEFAGLYQKKNEELVPYRMMLTLND